MQLEHLNYSVETAILQRNAVICPVSILYKSIAGRYRHQGSCFLDDRMKNKINPDENVHYEPSHLDLHCLQKKKKKKKKKKSFGLQR